MSAIVAEDLTKVYGGRPAVDHLSFELPWGRVTGFLGPNGAGKTTTLRMLLGLAAPSAGSGTVAGVAYGNLPRPSRVVGALLETQQFHPLRSARNHLRVFAAAEEIPDRRVEEVLELVELSGAGRQKVGQFSMGMRQRLGLAAALLGDPRLLILDEPANGLDPSGIRWLRSFLRSYATDDRAVFVSSHLLAEIAQVAEEVVVINGGSLVAHAPVADLLDRAVRSIRVRTEKPEHLRAVMVTSGAQAEMVSHDTLVIRSATVEDIGRAAAAERIPVFALEPEERSLEDVFFELTKSGAHS